MHPLFLSVPYLSDYVLGVDGTPHNLLVISRDTCECSTVSPDLQSVVEQPICILRSYDHAINFSSRFASHPPPHPQMDKALLSAVDRLPPITSTVTSLHTAASTALYSTRSATAFLLTPQLASRRVQRAENLLRHLRETVSEFRALYAQLVSALRATIAMKQAGKVRWDRLSDGWWRERAEGVLNLVMEVGRSVEEVELQLVEGGDYVSRVDRVLEKAELVVRGWKRVVSFVEGWEPIARAVCEGLGEEGSLLPA